MDGDDPSLRRPPHDGTAPAEAASNRTAALEWADRARSTRAGLRADLAAERVSLAEVVDRRHSDEFVGVVKLLWVLESLPGARKVDTRRTLAALGLPSTATLSDLDPSTAAAVLDVFGPPAGSADVGEGE